MDKNFEVHEDGTVHSKNITPRYVDGRAINLGDVVFEYRNGDPYGPYVITNMSSSPVGIILSLTAYPIIGPKNNARVTTDDLRRLRRVTEADIKTLEAKWESTNAVDKVKRLKAQGCRVVRLWSVDYDHENVVVMTGGAPVSHIPIEALAKGLGIRYAYLDYDEVNDITDNTELLESMSASEIPDKPNCDLTDKVLGPSELSKVIKQWLIDEREVPEYIIDTLCDCARSSN